MSSNQIASIISIQLCLGHGEPMRVVEKAYAFSDFGLEGNRHSRNGSRRQILLVDEESLEVLRLSSGELRENITTSGLDVPGLVEGQKLSLGDDVIIEVTGYCEPCYLLDEIRDGLQEVVDGIRGMLAIVIKGGEVKVGDLIHVL